MKDLPAIERALVNPGNVIITTHAHPDADALGSSLGLQIYLQSKGHSVKVITPTDYPDFLKWMAGNEDVVVYDSDRKEAFREEVHAADLIFCLDFSDLKRIDELGELIGSSVATKIVIDHHRNPQDFCDMKIHSIDAAATAELVYDLIVRLDGDEVITKDMADCLYAGLMTDTGSFRHNNVNAKVFQTAASLVERGADPNGVARSIYDTNSLNRLRFLGYALYDLLQVDLNHGVGYFVISNEDAARFNLQSGDTEGLVNYALSVKGIKVAALFRQKDEMVKISFRSINQIAVNTFAAEYFDGGGHLNAAGGRSLDTLEETVARFRKLIEDGKLV